MFQTKAVKKIKHILFSVIFFFENRTAYEKTSKKYCRAVLATDDNMDHAHHMLDTKSYKYTHSGFVILNAFPQQQRLHERVLVLRYTCISCLVFYSHYRKSSFPF
jgi:hypothetical protein